MIRLFIVIANFLLLCLNQSECFNHTRIYYPITSHRIVISKFSPKLVNNFDLTNKNNHLIVKQNDFSILAQIDYNSIFNMIMIYGRLLALCFFAKGLNLNFPYSLDSKSIQLSITIVIPLTIIALIRFHILKDSYSMMFMQLYALEEYFNDSCHYISFFILMFCRICRRSYISWNYIYSIGEMVRKEICLFY